VASSPYINHFLQPDSLIPAPSNPQAWNRYSYVGNRPVNFNDPTGHDADCGIGDNYCNDAKREYHYSWKKTHHKSNFNTFLRAKDAFEFYNNHPDIALRDMYAGRGKTVGSYDDVDSYTLGSIYAEDVKHVLFNPVTDDFILREIDRIHASSDNVDPFYISALFFGLFVVMGPDGGGGGGIGDTSFSNLGIRTTSHFQDRLVEWGIPEEEALNVYLNGKKYTNASGEWMVWDPKAKLAIRVDNGDYGAITIFEQEQLPRSWLPGWYDE
jgi:hypothetical protein